MRPTPSTETRHPPNDVISTYFALLYMAIIAMMAMFWRYAGADSLSGKAFTAFSTIGYAFLYLLVPLSLTALTLRAFRPGASKPGWQTALAYAVAYLGGTLTLLCLYADYRIYGLYEYHFNGFIWNLLTTPGGIAALGATDSTLQTVALQVGLFFITTAVVLWLLHRRQHGRRLLSRRFLMASAGIALFSFLGTEGVFAYSTYTGQEDYLQAAETIPFRLHTSATTLFKRLGIKRTALSNLRIAGGDVSYPAKDLQSTPLKSYPNIIMLVGESFRWDLLDPEITPNLWKLSAKSMRFEQHYSGGNRTRMGLFSMFYGIYAPYWYSFERQRVAPALMEFVRAKNYQLALHTSQSFDYPELRHTLFTGIPEQYLQELKAGAPWKRDTQNITDIIGKLEQRDRQRPFFGFMFFESTHAPYTFPEETALLGDYQKDLNYINMNLQENVKQIHARYVNAAHHIDLEVGRLLDYLKRSGMLDNTIVLFTGDHGEEFMEKGHWGHGHGRTFPEEQIRVPLVLHIPGRTPTVVRHRTTHLQISPTLLGELGVLQDPRSYSSADTLFAPASDYFVVGEYDYIGIIDNRYKITFPYTSSDFFRYTINDAKDNPVPREDKKRIVALYQGRIDEVIRESRRFAN
ncbi:MAG: sulfatase-like hydrolase/transferase [Rhodocyclaceae bacterium]|nr:sulfatase-like hydrolase/transferase [Rhodocyclaceae bacterium]